LEELFDKIFEEFLINSLKLLELLEELSKRLLELLEELFDNILEEFLINSLKLLELLKELLKR